MDVSAASEPPPRPPVEPDAAECCGEGCTHCVFDLYDAALERYRLALTVWQARQSPAADGLESAPPAGPQKS